jgi:dTDP-glucose 4,6-dehydratase
VYKGHKRIIDYVDDTCKTVANIVDNFIPGMAYNIGGKNEWEMSIEEYAQIVLKETGTSNKLISYREKEPYTTLVKKMDFSKSIRDLQHNPEIDPFEGIKRTVNWMKLHYRII